MTGDTAISEPMNFITPPSQIAGLGTDVAVVITLDLPSTSSGSLTLQPYTDVYLTNAYGVLGTTDVTIYGTDPTYFTQGLQLEENFYGRNLIVNNYGVLKAAGSFKTVWLSGSVTNNLGGLVTLGNGTGLISDSYDNIGTTDMSDSTSITVVTFTNAGTVSMTSSTIVATTITNTGTISGCGTLDTTTLSNSGTIDIGCSPTSITITGDAIFSFGSIISPYLESTGLAELIVSGNLTLDPGVSLVFSPELGCYTMALSFRSYLWVEPLREPFLL